MSTPKNKEELVRMFGNPLDYLDELGNPTLYWVSNHLTTVYFPEPLPLDFDNTQVATRYTCHKLLEGKFKQVFKTIHDNGLWPDLKDWGGCYRHRAKRNNPKELSTHAWGIACDIDPSGNPMGTEGIIPLEIVKIFKVHGFAWGGDWDYPDPMHFQYCFGY